MKTSELYISFFKALKDKWENPIRDFLKEKLSWNLRRGNLSHSISVDHTDRNGDLIMLLQLEKIIEEFKSSKFHPMDCRDLDFSPENILNCIRKTRTDEEDSLNWDSLSRIATNPKSSTEEKFDKYEDFDKHPKNIFIKDGPFEILELYGVYKSRAPRSFRSQVEIFISKIYYDCLSFGWDVEALYVIVLCHELAHGYHHLGIDSDDNYWQNYNNLDIKIKEGLAQYYTEKFITSNLECKSKQFITVFNDLCSKQSPQYRIHQTWPKQSYEATRIVMVESRRNYIANYSPFENLFYQYTNKGI